MAEETAKLMSGAGLRLDPTERRLLAGMPQHAITSCTARPASGVGMPHVVPLCGQRSACVAGLCGVRR